MSTIQPSFIWSDIVSCILGQICCIYFLARSTVFYLKHIKQFSNCSIGFVEAILGWIAAITCFIINTYFFRNIFRNDSLLDIEHCHIWRITMRSLIAWHKVLVYLQITSVIVSVTSTCNINIELLKRKIGLLRILLITMGIIAQIGILLRSKNDHKIVAVSDGSSWMVCYMEVSIAIGRKVTQGIFCVATIVVSFWLSKICYQFTHTVISCETTPFH